MEGRVRGEERGKRRKEGREKEGRGRSGERKSKLIFAKY